MSNLQLFSADVLEMEHKKSNKQQQPKYPTTFDELLPEVGQYGLYQILLFFSLLPFCFFIAFIYMSQMFITLVPEDYGCLLPQIENATEAQVRQLLIPQSNGQYSKCERYNVDPTGWTAADIPQLMPQQATWNTTKCSDWQYDRSEVPYESIATEFNWVCDEGYYPTLAIAIYYVGAIVGGLVIGWVADHYGRMPALVICNMVGFAGGMATIYSTNFWTFAIYRFFVGFAYDNCYMMLYVIALEYTGARWRTFVANMSIGIFFTTAMCLTPWIAIWTNGWRTFTLVTTLPLLGVLITPFLIPESARWLLSQGKVKKCVQIMRSIAKINYREVDNEVFEQFEKQAAAREAAERALSAKREHLTIIDLFRHPNVRRITILLCVMWMSTTFVFDGHARNAGSIGSNLFVVHTIGSFTEFPADIVLVLILDKAGRRWPCSLSLILGGIFSLIATLVPFGTFSATLAILGRASANFSFNLGCQYAAELLPTVVRGQGIAFIHIMGYVASILAPFVVYLANISKVLPLIILGAIGIVGGSCCLFLPESLGCELPQTLEDGKKLKNDKFFSYGACRPSQVTQPCGS